MGKAPPPSAIPVQTRPPLTLSSLDDALARLLATVPPLTEEASGLREAVGCVLAVPLAAPAPYPQTAVARMDGFAVSSGDLVGASAYAPVPAAEPPPFVSVSEALPPGADAIVAPDAVTILPGFCEILAAPAPGEGVRRAGEDAGAGAVLREAGTRLRAVDATAALAAGLEACLVRRPRLRIVTAGRGSEAFVAGLATRYGAEVTLAPMPAEPAGLSEVLAEPSWDLVVTLGRTGLGPRDWAPEAIATTGTPLFHGLGLRPGGTAAGGLVGGRPVLLLPGRPEEAIAAALALLPPVLACLTGADAPDARPVRLSRKIASTVGLAEIALLRLSGQEAEPLGCGDLTLAMLARADAWLLLPPGSEGHAAGETVAVRPL